MKNMIRSSFILLAFLAMAFGALAADWPMFRGNPGRTGCYPEPVGCPAGAPAWKTRLGGPIISSPSVKDGLLYIGSRDSCIYAINAASGAVLWRRKTGSWVDASPLVDGSLVFAGSRDSTIYVIEKKFGTIFTRLSAGVQLSSPAVSARGDIVCGLGLPGGGIGTYGAASLSKRTGAAAAQWIVPLPQYTYSSPAIHGQAIVVGATDGTLYGIDAGYRKIIWRRPTDGIVYLSTPAIDDTVVYFASGDEDRNVYAVNLLNGKEMWRNDGAPPVPDPVSGMAKWIAPKILPSNGVEQLLRMSPALRKKNIGNLRQRGIELPRLPLAWIKGLAKTTVAGEFIPLDGMKTSSVAVGANGVFVVQKQLGYVLTNDSLADYKQKYTLLALNKKNGSRLWSFTDLRRGTEHGYCSSPVVAGSLVFFGWGEGRVYGFHTGTGEKVWEDSLEGNILSSPSIADNRLYFATLDGYVYAYNLDDTPPGLDFKRSTYCYPNPARGAAANIQVYAEKAGTVVIALYSLAEKPVLVQTQRLSAAEKYTYSWDLRKVANGVYFAVIKLTYDDGKADRKLLKIAVLK